VRIVTAGDTSGEQLVGIVFFVGIILCLFHKHCCGANFYADSRTQVAAEAARRQVEAAGAAAAARRQVEASGAAAPARRQVEASGAAARQAERQQVEEANENNNLNSQATAVIESGQIELVVDANNFPRVS
jgi:hypothetical protein